MQYFQHLLQKNLFKNNWTREPIFTLSGSSLSVSTDKNDIQNSIASLIDDMATQLMLRKQSIIVIDEVRVAHRPADVSTRLVLVCIMVTLLNRF